MFKWLKKKVFNNRNPFIVVTFKDYMKDEFKRMAEERKKNKEVWHYVCNNGHRWKSYSSPTGSFCSSRYGMKETACPKCGNTVCLGEVFKDGVKMNMGAMHVDFGRKEK